MKFFILLISFFTFGSAEKGFGPGEQLWGHIKVREGAHMFYWLYLTTAPVNYTERPLIVWLQGGPGSSSAGFGNFEEIGPLDLNLNSRNHTWVNNFNVLFIDNPVGTGFSYVEKNEFYARNNTQIALDLVGFIKEFYLLKPEFKDVDLHIFSQSYGGKMAAEFALEMYRSMKRNEINCTLKSVSLGNAFISPIDYVTSWAPFLLQMGFVDYKGHGEIEASAKIIEDLLNNDRMENITKAWEQTQAVVGSTTQGVHWYNVLRKTKLLKMTKNNDSNDIDEIFADETIHDQLLEKLILEDVSIALNISKNISFTLLSDEVFDALAEDFMKPVIHIVEQLLNETNINVTVYNGNLDLICATSGTIKWIEKMNWNFKEQYEAAPRQAFGDGEIRQGYVKSFDRFSMYWINEAGHMVPEDNPIAMNYVLTAATGYNVTSP